MLFNFGAHNHQYWRENWTAAIYQNHTHWNDIKRLSLRIRRNNGVQIGKQTATTKLKLSKHTTTNRLYFFYSRPISMALSSVAIVLLFFGMAKETREEMFLWIWNRLSLKLNDVTLWNTCVSVVLWTSFFFLANWDICAILCNHQTHTLSLVFHAYENAATILYMCKKLRTHFTNRGMEFSFCFRAGYKLYGCVLLLLPVAKVRCVFVRRLCMCVS